jgi:cysteinyl-tRNA synthetase
VIPSFVEDVLGLMSETSDRNEYLDKTVELLIKIRSESRLKRDFTTADKIRNELEQAGIKLLDGKMGTTYQLD